MELGQKITFLRKKRRMNQKQLAEASGLTQATISRIESGDVTELRTHTFKRLAEALGVTVDYLIGKTEKISPSDIIESDTDAQIIFRGYERLDAEGKKQLKDFVKFLEKRHGKR